MELDELDISDPRSSAECECDAITGRDRGIGRLREDLSEPTRCDDDCSCLDLSYAISTSLSDHVKRHARNLSLIREKCIKDERVFDHFNSLVITHRSKESARDLLTCGIATCMEDSISKVSTFASECDLSGHRSIEDRAACDQTSDRFWTFCHQDLDRTRITESCTCSKGVLFMGCR
jgi:hypothetical protein